MPRPKVEAERRDQILRAACKVIAERGFRAVRVADVLQQRGRIDRDVCLVFDAQPARDVRRPGRQDLRRRQSLPSPAC